MKILDIQNLSCQFGQEAVLKSLDLAVYDKEIVCLLGASGCGKTTLLKAIAGLIPLTSGSISLKNCNLLQTPIEARKIGFIFQDYALFPHLNVAQNIQFGIGHLSRAEQEKTTQDLLALTHLTGLEQRYPHELSGGQQQRVAIARALACQPDLLLLDEPFSNIDSQTRYAMIQEIRLILKTQGVPAIFVTHSKEEAFAFADKIAVMEGGQIVQFGLPEALYHQPISKFVAEFLGGTNYLPCTCLSPNQLESALGLIQFEAPLQKTDQTPPLVGQGYTWLIRPEALCLKPNPNGPATIQNRLFLGQYFRYEVDLAGFVLTVFDSTRLEKGQRVELGFVGQRAVLLDS
ncbi:ABC transporter [Pasteurellaceae bacterium RH1A]|nr:ABC transporter [Pasteurellaceae bacterium RH1A]